MNVYESIPLRLMQLYRKILSLLLLSVFGMLLVHQILPHVHHEHDNSYASFEQVGHHHHNKDHDHEENDHSNGFLGSLLAGHLHSYHSSDFNVKETIVKKNIKVKVFSFYSLTVSIRFSINEHGKNAPPLVYHPPGFNTSPFLSTYSLRGPPVLG